MNLFYIGEANIYRSILKNISTSRAEQELQLERLILESTTEISNTGSDVEA